MIEVFEAAVAERFTGSKDNSVAELIKCQKRNLETKGDFAAPGDPKIWARAAKQPSVSELKFDTLSGLEHGCYKIESASVNKKGLLLIRLERKFLMEAALKRSVEGDFPSSVNPQTFKIENCEVRRERSSAMCQLRCQLVAFAAKKYLLAAGHQCKNVDNALVVRVGCTDEKLLANDDNAIPVQVGVVMDPREPKKRRCEDTSILPTYERLLRRYLRVASERDGDAVILPNVHRSASADLALQLLSVQTSSPAAVVTECPQAAAVLYNYVRLVHILKAYGGPVPEKVDFGLLREPEEWELAFVYVQGLQELLLVADPADLRLHRLAQLLFGLSSTFSRYYNRVHVLKESTASLRPTMEARVFLLAAIKAVYDKVFDILDIQPVYNM